MYIVIFVTASGKEEAKRIADGLIQKKLAACVNILDGVQSFFRWEGKIDQAEEALLIIKSKKAKLDAIIKTVKSLHSYEVPEVIALPILGGNKDYLRWLYESVG